MSLNKVQLIGNLTREPEMRQIPGGAVVASFSIATNFTWTDQSGQRQEKTEFHNIVVWRKLAEICGQYLKKGSKVYIEGRLQTRDWEGEDGVKRYRTEIVADNMIMLDGKKSDADAGMHREAAGIAAAGGAGAGSPESDSSSDYQHAAAGSSGQDDEVKIDDLPF